MSSSEQPPRHSAEYEGDAVSAPRFFRGALTTALVVIVAIVAVSVLGALVSRQRNESGGAGGDVHRPLSTGAVAEVDTKSGRKVAVVIEALTWDQGPVLDVKVEGVAVAPGAFTFVLEDGTVLELEATRNADGTVHLRFPGILQGHRVRFVHFDPDDSRGDIYFDVE